MTEPLTLRNLLPGQHAEIVRVTGHGPIRRRLAEMGFVRGGTVRVERVAPLGDPVEYCIKGYCLALRREEAAQIEVRLTIGAAHELP
jgi:ferrous iron transport protein A